jgi:hypothetical protein
MNNHKQVCLALPDKIMLLSCSFENLASKVSLVVHAGVTEQANKYFASAL